MLVCLFNVVFRGKFGVVAKGECILANDPTLPDPVARKCYAIKSVPKACTRAKDLTNLQREIEIMDRVNHPNVIRLVELIETQTHYFFVIP